jgi:hypothetical protein
VSSLEFQSKLGCAFNSLIGLTRQSLWKGRKDSAMLIARLMEINDLVFLIQLAEKSTSIDRAVGSFSI